MMFMVFEKPRLSTDELKAREKGEELYGGYLATYNPPPVFQLLPFSKCNQVFGKL